MSFPLYSITLNLDYDKDKLYKSIIDDFNTKWVQDFLNNGNNNFSLSPIHEPFNSMLYNKLVEECTKLFGAINIHSNNNKKLWVYMNNKRFYKNGIHNHINTSTINAVYYLNVPDTNSGAINFYENDKVILSYQPKEKELIIFPNYVYHEPQQSMTEEYRIGINMEIKCNDIWERVNSGNSNSKT